MEKDAFGNIPLHYAYSCNNPPMRDILRAYILDRETREKMNDKPNAQGDSPSDMLHNIKVESSDDDEEKKQRRLRKAPKLTQSGCGVPEQYKSRLYKKPDFAFVILASSRTIFGKELQSLVDRGSVYYEVFDRDHLEEKVKTLLVVIFFDDPIIDTQAEVMKVRARM